MGAAQDMPVRRMNFEFADDMDLVFIQDDPRLSYFFVGAWMMLPYLEPFLIRTIQEAMGRIRDEALLEDMKRFCAQEGQHYRQHARANDIVRRRHPAGPRLMALEQEFEALLKRWSHEKPLRFRLAYAEGFESMTCAGARTQMEIGMFDDMKEPIRGLMLWHIMEEIEHRTVCFDAYHRAVGDYVYRLGVGVWAQNHYLRWCQRFAAAMIEADPQTIARFDHPDLRAKCARRAQNYFRNLLPKQLATYMPWYDPRRIRLPDQFEPARQTYTRLAASVH